MNRFRVSELIAGFLLGFASLLLIFLLSSDIAAHYELCETTKEGAKECSQYGPIGFVFREIVMALNDYNGLITAVATIFIAWFTLSLRQSTEKLWSAGERQTELTRETSTAQSSDMQASIGEAVRAANAMEQVAEGIAVSANAAQESVVTLKERTAMQMRAYVSVSVGVAIYQERERGLRFEARPLIVNTGHTPAHNLGFQAAARILPIPIANTFDFPIPEQRIGAAMLGPQQNFTMKVVVPEYVHDEEVAGIKQGDGRALCVWGLVTYADAFGEPRETRFSQILFWLRDDNGITGHYTEQHNEAT
jgi:hypothetical protein